MEYTNKVEEFKTQDNKIEGGEENMKDKNIELKEELSEEVKKHLDSIRIWGNDIPAPNNEYNLQDFIPNTDENGYCKWEYDEQSLWDGRGFTHMRIMNMIQIISTNGLTSVSALYIALKNNFTDYFEDIYDALSYTNSEKTKHEFYCKYQEEKEEYLSSKKEIHKNRAIFNAIMYKLCERVIPLEDILDESIEIYTIHNLLLEIINEVSKGISTFLLNESLEDRLIKIFNKIMLIQWLVDLDEVKEMIEREE